MNFEFPVALILLAVLPVIYMIMRRGERTTMTVAAIYRGQAPARRYYQLRHLLAGLFLGSITMVSARPYIESGRSGDVLFLVDVSRSMDARHSCGDMTFLSRAKNVMRDVLTGIPEARFGIIAFDRFAFPITHLTRDRTYLEDVITKAVHIGLTFEATRTELANALGVAAAKKQRLPEIFGGVSDIILLSDGHIAGDYTRSLREPLQQLREAGIRILSVGIGNPGETPIMSIDREQCTNEFIELDGKVVNIPLRDDILKHIASETNGQYFAEGDTANLTRVLREGLARIGEGEQVEGGRYRRDISQIFLVVASISLFGLILLGSGLVRWNSPVKPTSD